MPKSQGKYRFATVSDKKFDVNGSLRNDSSLCLTLARFVKPPKLSSSSGLYYKCFTIVIYDHNDSGLYYKTTITIVIDDPS
jgi:hypothetical protein